MTWVDKKIKESDPAQPEPMCEIARSFSFKLNTGNYESRDFFCSQKVECLLSKAAEMSEKVYQFCKSEVMKSVAEYKKQNNMK